MSILIIHIVHYLYINDEHPSYQVCFVLVLINVCCVVNNYVLYVAVDERRNLICLGVPNTLFGVSGKYISTPYFYFIVLFPVETGLGSVVGSLTGDAEPSGATLGLSDYTSVILLKNT